MLEWLEHTQFSAFVRTELWGWPLALTFHALGTALALGLIFVIGLRLLGLFTLIPYASLDRLFPVFWAALVVQFLSGFTLWMAKPTQYFADGAFVLKFVLIFVGMYLTSNFYRTIIQESASWDARGAISSRATKFVAATLFVWCMVLILGRLTAQLGAISIS